MNYAIFDGRASRSEFWWFILFWLACSAVASAFGDLARGLTAVVFMLPLLAVLARRLHDAGRNGWWVLIGAVPLLGWLVLLYFAVQPSDGPNEHGQAAA